MSTTRNPAWERDELILALDLYFAYAPKLPPSTSAPDVIALSYLLNALPIFPPEQRQGNFRNPAGVYMKLANFRALDPHAPSGFSAVGHRDREVWAEFAHDRGRLRDLAAAIRSNARSEETQQAVGEEEWQEEAREGRVLMRLHRFRERSATLVKQRKARAHREQGRLQCEACGFDFHEIYDALGEGFIECHHTVPVSELSPGQTTRASDLALLCANCHRMIHRSKVPLTVDALRAIVITRRAH